MSESENPTENAKRGPCERHLEIKCAYITRYWGKGFKLKKCTIAMKLICK